jgi:hypothetical protein
MRMPLKFVLAGVFTVVLTGEVTGQTSMVPKKHGSGCPAGSSDVSGGYCRSNAGKRYIKKNKGAGCPSGTSDAGGGYCMVR